MKPGGEIRKTVGVYERPPPPSKWPRLAIYGVGAILGVVSLLTYCNAT